MVATVKHFLLVFDRSEPRLLHITHFETADKALEERFEAEKRHRGNPGIEVVVLTAESKEALKQTHSRYFATDLSKLTVTPAKKAAAARKGHTKASQRDHSRVEKR